MPDIRTGKTFGTAIAESLVERGGYTQGSADDYSIELGMFKPEVIDFIRATQAEKYGIYGVASCADTSRA